MLSVVLIRAAGLPLVALECPIFDENKVETEWNQSKTALQSLAVAWPEILKLVLNKLPESELRTTVYNLSRKIRKQLAAGNFSKIVKHLEGGENLPELLNAIDQWNYAIKTEQDCWWRFQEHYRAVLSSEMERLQHLSSGKTLQRALLFTSHDLLKQLSVWSKKVVVDFTKKDRQIARSVWQYAARAAFKTSPRSHFTTVGVWNTATPSAAIETQDNLYFDKIFTSEAEALRRQNWPVTRFGESQSSNTSKITPNVALLPLIYDALLREPAFYQSLNIALNPCITQVESFNYEWLYFDGEQESFQKMIPAAGIDFIVEKLLEKSRICSYPELFTALEVITEDKNQSEQFLFALLDTGFLEWELPDKGLSPSWCTALYNYLGWLPLEPMIVESAMLLQWLRTAARTLPFQSVEETLVTQQEGANMITDFLKKYGVETLPIPPEQVFFEDVVHPQERPKYAQSLQEWADQLSVLIQTSGIEDTITRILHGRGAVERAKLSHFFQQNYPFGATVSFLEFCEKYLKNFTFLKFSYQKNNPEFKNNAVKTGALLQPFHENGHLKAVVNAIYPGGGKLLARCLFLFPDEIGKAVQEWNDAPEIAPFPWQHWSNAAFQPAIGGQRVMVPGNRIRPQPNTHEILLGNIQMRYGENGLELLDNETQKMVRFVDLGLDAPDARPPVIRALLQAGCEVPFIAVEGGGDRVEGGGDRVEGGGLKVEGGGDGVEGGGGWFEIIEARSRIESGNLVLSRAMWRVSVYPATNKQPPANSPLIFYQLRSRLRQLDVPRYFFVRSQANFAEKPQYIDQESPMSMQIFEKIIKQHVAHELLLTEMLPTPDSLPGDRAEEVAIEFMSRGY